MYSRAINIWGLLNHEIKLYVVRSNTEGIKSTIALLVLYPREYTVESSKVQLLYRVLYPREYTLEASKV